MLDLDHFKRFNDTFGHNAGDSLLRELGQLLREKLRKSDISYRYGGEEFVLILPDSSLADTRQRVEQIRGLIKELKIRHGDQLLGTITLSAGIAGAPGAHSHGIGGFSTHFMSHFSSTQIFFTRSRRFFGWQSAQSKLHHSSRTPTSKTSRPSSVL